MYKVTESMRENFEDRSRARLMNSLTGPKSASLIGTRSLDGLTNCSIFSSTIHLGANPALIGLVVRPDSVDRHTLTNILETKSYTINTVSYSFVEKAHQTSARYAREESEFEYCELTEEYLDDCFAPFVKESQVKWSMKYLRKVDIAENGTHLIIGAVENIYFPEKIWDQDGHLHLHEIDPAVVIGLDEYAKLECSIRFSYAKPKQKLSTLKFNKRL